MAHLLKNTIVHVEVATVKETDDKYIQFVHRYLRYGKLHIQKISKLNFALTFL